MNIKQLIKEVENLIDDCPNWKDCECENAIQLQAIRKTVEAVDIYLILGLREQGLILDYDMEMRENYKDWQTLKKLLGVK